MIHYLLRITSHHRFNYFTIFSIRTFVLNRFPSWNQCGLSLCTEASMEVLRKHDDVCARPRAHPLVGSKKLDPNLLGEADLLIEVNL